MVYDSALGQDIWSTINKIYETDEVHSFLCKFRMEESGNGEKKQPNNWFKMITLVMSKLGNHYY